MEQLTNGEREREKKKDLWRNKNWIKKKTGDKWPRKRTRLIFIAWRRPASSSRRPKRKKNFREDAWLLYFFFSLFLSSSYTLFYDLDGLWCNMHNVKVLRLPAGAPILWLPLKETEGAGRASSVFLPLECWLHGAKKEPVSIVLPHETTVLVSFPTSLPHGNRSRRAPRSVTLYNHAVTRTRTHTWPSGRGEEEEKIT